MKFKMIIAIVSDNKTEQILKTAREAGATGCTVIASARGEGLKPSATFLGLTLEGQRDVVLLLVEEHLSRHILERIAVAGRFDETVGAGVAFQLDIEDAVGMGTQIKTIVQELEDEL